MFQLTPDEAQALRFQSGTSNVGRGGRRYLPYVFTEHGVAMLSSVLNSSHAIHMNILIVRVFVRVRELAASHDDLAARIEHVETLQTKHTSVIRAVADEIEKLKLIPPAPPKRRIGFAQSAGTETV